MSRLVVAIVVGSVVTAVGTAAPVFGQDVREPAPIFDLLQGEWEGRGILMGRDGEFTLSWDHRGRYAVLSFSNAFVDTGGAVTPVLTSAAVYRTSPAHGDAVWLDSRGVRIEIRWEADDSTLLSHWTAPTEEGRTTYRILADERLEVTDEVVGDQGLRVFARATYVRTGG